MRQKSLWKALQPLLTAFRNAKELLVNADLSPASRLVLEIIGFFRSSDAKALKHLRIDMAAHFCRFLNPAAKTPRGAARYTAQEKGNATYFRLDFTEPSPLFRYAYARALADLAVVSDGKGHFFKKTLDAAIEAEPCPEVKKQLETTREKLRRIRENAAPGRDTQRLYEAFWQLRQAHALSFGADIDEEASKLLRVREWRDERRL
jgi:hypothetical protein